MAYLRRIYSNVDGSSVGLLPLYPFYVDAILLAVDADDLANLLTFKMATNHLQFKFFGYLKKPHTE